MFPHVLKTTLGDVSASQSDSQSIGKIAKQQTHSFNKKRSQYTNQSNRHKQSLMNNQIKSIIDYSRMLAGKYQLNSHRQNEQIGCGIDGNLEMADQITTQRSLERLEAIKQQYQDELKESEKRLEQAQVRYHMRLKENKVKKLIPFGNNIV